MVDGAFGRLLSATNLTIRSESLSVVEGSSAEVSQPTNKIRNQECENAKTSQASALHHRLLYPRPTRSRQTTSRRHRLLAIAEQINRTIH